MSLSCVYDWSVTSGRIPGGTFYAPASPTTVIISIAPFMGDDASKKCDQIQVRVNDAGGCGAAIIGFTTQQMSVSESQTLTVNNPESGVTYRWKITAGAGSLSATTGLSTVYTAPSSNANCTNNPTISLYANGCELCNSLTIAVNNPAVAGAAYVSYRIYHYPEASTENVCAKNMIKRLYTCANIATGLPMTIEACCLYSWTCDWGTNCSSCTDALLLSQCAAIEGYSCAANKDARTAEMKEQGCCPAGLL